MIQFENVEKKYATRLGMRTVFKEINLKINPGDKLGILGRNGAGKSTLIRLISGAEQPSAGQIKREMTVSWPLAFGGGFQGSLTGADNLRFICRIYGLEFADKIDFVQDFTELGTFFDEPVKNYSSGMQARLAFAISMAIEFDCYLIDEVIAVGDSRFHEKCHYELFEKRKDRAFVIVSHHPDQIQTYCTQACVLLNGALYEQPSVSEAYAFYNENL
ncbi:Polysialic acid transport ATP-binding protein KpsT [Legionella massiliensis]|uniref:Polysialic acid transport ATP-binding protein KpsT n=1 Tax=Legionella massiliensis TaxID=1034943 RepID=A0A078KTQ6_9GAMM|nr:ABC transporter ATP-binding protein [Legionella massiliensis]CDZ77845.1 Polysialic acid transport ATP-binding protein KpsT [Legionella massiliensis]CEE13583.1 Polysialic acid transport ATP-binding protein KpsT [Legionella massiliensis]